MNPRRERMIHIHEFRFSQQQVKVPRMIKTSLLPIHVICRTYNAIVSRYADCPLPRPHGIRRNISDFALLVAHKGFCFKHRDIFLAAWRNPRDVRNRKQFFVACLRTFVNFLKQPFSAHARPAGWICPSVSWIEEIRTHRSHSVTSTIPSSTFLRSNCIMHHLKNPTATAAVGFFSFRKFNS